MAVTILSAAFLTYLCGFFRVITDDRTTTLVGRVAWQLGCEAQIFSSGICSNSSLLKK